MIYDPIRKKNLETQPEELVRQAFITKMIDELGYPKELIAVEQQLQNLPHILKKNDIPNRRLDIICYGKNIHPKFELYPLLMIECKAVKLTSYVIQQVVSYNYYVNAYFVAIANEKEIKTGWYDNQQQKYNFINGLPHYQSLLENSLEKL